MLLLMPLRFVIKIVEDVISASLQACGMVLPFASPTSICRNSVTICSALSIVTKISSCTKNVQSPGHFGVSCVLSGDKIQ